MRSLAIFAMVSGVFVLGVIVGDSSAQVRFASVPGDKKYAEALKRQAKERKNYKP